MGEAQIVSEGYSYEFNEEPGTEGEPKAGAPIRVEQTPLLARCDCIGNRSGLNKRSF